MDQQFLDRLAFNKALSDTRCSVRYDVVRADGTGYSANMQAFDELASHGSQPYGNRIEAGKLKKLKTSILLKLWNAILNIFHKTNLPCKKSAGA